MGCDIHTFIERKANIRGEEKWVFLHGVNGGGSGRNYSFFGELAGVRYETPTAMEPRGLPDDASDYVVMDYDNWGYDAHTQSHCTLDEFVQAYMRSCLDSTKAQFTAQRLEGGDPKADLMDKFFGFDDEEHAAESQMVYLLHTIELKRSKS